MIDLSYFLNTLRSHFPTNLHATRLPCCAESRCEITNRDDVMSHFVSECVCVCVKRDAYLTGNMMNEIPVFEKGNPWFVLYLFSAHGSQVIK